MTVYVLLRGIYYEGSRVEGVFTTFEKAAACVPPSFLRTERDTWRDGSEYFSIDAYEVR